MTEPIRDPNLAALAGADPAGFLQQPAGSAPPPAGHGLDPVAVELAVAFVAVCGLVAHFLAGQDPRPGEVTVLAGQAWRNHAPLWLRMAVPAIRHAYALGRVQGLDEAELEAMATDYAVNLGDYLHESSGQALTEGYARQLDARWNEGLAWRRAAAAYGLDRQQMRSYLSGVLNRSEQAGKADPAPAAGRLLVEKLLVRRAERMGVTESWRAMQSGRAIVWLLQAQTGQLPPGTLKQWDTRPGACAICQALHEQRVPVTEPFVHPVSKVALWAPGAHPECRCGMHLAREPLAKAAVSAAGVCLVAADTGRVLMLQRALEPGDPAGGLWEFPGGGLEPGEQPRRGANREFGEEVHRRLPGDARHIGHWIQGVYQGFVLITATEGAVEPHRRGRVVNPDDPDGDAIEALAWWDPDQLARNPAVRPEVRQALPAIRLLLLGRSRLAKARDGDPYDRDRHGRFARAESRRSRPVREAEARTADPAVERVLRDLERVKQPFTEPPLFQAPLFQSRPFQGGQLFRAPDRDLFRRPGMRRGPSPFDRVKHPAGPGRRPDGRPHPRQRVIRHFLLEPRTGAHRHEPYYLPVEEFAAAYEESADSQIWTPGDFVDFADANEALRLNSSYFEGMDRPRSGLAAFHWERPLPEMVDLDQPWTDERGTEEQWAEILPLVRSLAQDAIDNAGHVLPALLKADLRAIHVMAGLEPDGQSEMAMRERILRAAQGQDGGDGSLLGSYVDHMVWSEPGMLGEAGSALSRMLEQALSEEVMVWGPERLQFFAFRDGFHQALDPGRHTADPDGDYVVDQVTYHSPLLEQGSGMRPWVLGWREVGLVPVDQHGNRLPVD